MLLHLGWRLAALPVRLLPRRLAYLLADALLTLAWLAWPRGRRALRANLATVLATGLAPSGRPRLRAPRPTPSAASARRGSSTSPPPAPRPACP